ncbi:tRNA (adenosine(37)-N6)-threonylcarbamoyltransferase complex dimerization subunit type 1 TsaB [Parachlamydia sp. AcF125]|uniref:tRNA (adenosine(37)-N6)-threonylcarbamoyltransferase complex dimerization subunit type 1 TsaB n=1 Tax=Parachlamydia sp. AcF125 TaxID=2795736 RepID=UPI001BC9C120|nr:tRNA (adenosine(37)-N6)-threonylcarbamoyltransferase complex dimerization subunit type 1 TsaB [Parachlamydia sp. AcF125]MBS4167959.1 tRNA threonylcarbamoyladenosine biosynthesis protein TsaB [Parachlamydia sp. AcF125]
MNYSLLIETSTERGLIAIFADRRVVFQKAFPFGNSSSSHLLPAIQEGLTTLKLNPVDFSHIICGAGPGSYTGLRMGAISAKVLAYSLHLPLIGISSLKGWVPPKDGHFSALIDARIGGVYIQSGVQTEGKVSFEPQPKLCLLEDLAQEIEKSEVLITPNLSILQPKILQACPFLQKEWIETSPSPHALYEAALEEIQAGRVSHEGNIDLLYLRKTQAEIEKEKIRACF